MTRRQRLSAAPGQGPTSQGGPEPETQQSEGQAPFLASQPELPAPTFSAEVVTGKMTNRVKVRATSAPRTARQPKRYKADPTRGQGEGYRIVCISMSPAELAELDAFAERVQMARSHLIRRAVKHFRVKVLG